MRLLAVTAAALVFQVTAHAAVLPPGAPAQAVAMVVRGVGVHDGAPVVVLEAPDKRLLPVWIGNLEANAIDMRLRKQTAPRPLTHDLLESTLAALGARVERVEIDDLRDNTFHGKLTLRDAKGQSHRIDARPSDCIALAAKAGLPIYVAPHVLEAAGIDAKRP